MQTLIVNERTLNDDALHIADSGKIFKGSYVAILEYFTFANEWSDSKHIKRFRTMDTLHNYLEKNYPEFDNLTLVFQA